MRLRRPNCPDTGLRIADKNSIISVKISSQMEAQNGPDDL